MKILAINPGSTSTKIGVYDDTTKIFEHTLRHSSEEIAEFENLIDQYDFRKNLIISTVNEKGMKVSDFDAIVGRGGLVKPISGGTYIVNDAMLKDLRQGVQGQHASNLGGIIANEIANEIGVPAYIVDPVVVDERDDIAKISGHPKLPRRCIFHALNQKSIAKQYCKDENKKYDDVNLIVVHMGGGITVGLHRKGAVVDVNNGLDGDGPFSPERSGTLPVADLMKLCFSGEYTEKEVDSMIKGKGGMVAFFGTNNMEELTNRAETEEEVALVMDAMCYQISKDIGALAAANCGKIDAILLTGGIAYSKRVTSYIEQHVNYIAPVKVYAGEDELAALVFGALRVLNGEEEAKIY